MNQFSAHLQLQLIVFNKFHIVETESCYTQVGVFELHCCNIAMLKEKYLIIPF